MENHKLREIKIQGYKSIKEASVPIKDLNILIGQNGAGKSNFIQVFNFLKNLIDQRLQQSVLMAGGANSLLYQGLKVTPKLRLSIDLFPNFYDVILLPNQLSTLFIEGENVGYISEPQKHDRASWKSITDFSNESSLKNSNHKYSQYTYKTLSSWNLYHFHDTSPQAKVKQFSKVYDVERLHNDAGNLAAFLLKLSTSHPEHYDRIKKQIRLVLPQFDDFYLVKTGNDNMDVMLLWKANDSDHILGPNALSDGSLRFICLTVLLMQPELPRLILIDEPELGLHPVAIMYLAAMLRRASKTSQVIVSTQSVSLVNEFEPEDIVVVDHNRNDGTTFKRLDSDDLKLWLDQYTIGEMWQRNLIGGQP